MSGKMYEKRPEEDARYELCYALLQRRAVDRPVKAMGILDGIVEWIAEQIMYGLDIGGSITH